MRRWTVLIAVMALVVAIPAAASAAAPEVVEDFTASWEGLDPGATAACGFEVHSDGSETVKVTVFSNNDGEPTKVLVHVNGFNTISSPGGGTVTDNYAFRVIDDLVAGTSRTLGNVFNMHAKGGGILVNDSGFIEFSDSGVVIHGPHDAFVSDIGEVLCPVLAPPAP